MLVRETKSAPGPSGWTETTEYNKDGSSKVTKEYKRPASNGGIAKEVASYDSNGNLIETKKFDADGNEIKDPPVIPAGEKGSVEYLNKLNSNWNINPDDYKINYDEKGRVISLIPEKEVIVDASTGRILKGRQYNDGLHQAIQAKEGVPILFHTMMKPEM